MKKMILLAVVSACALDSGSALLAQRAAPQGFIGGVVRSSNGPEAGVWVIAETKDLPTNFIKIVVTDDQGRFMVPELPAAQLPRVGARVRPGRFDAGPGEARRRRPEPDGDAREDAAGSGQGLSGQLLAVAARAARSQRVSRHRAAEGNGIGNGMLTQNHCINSLKSDCNFCHQLGNAADARPSTTCSRRSPS